LRDKEEEEEGEEEEVRGGGGEAKTFGVYHSEYRVYTALLEIWSTSCDCIFVSFVLDDHTLV
jgi:hypothetical protein